MRQRKLWVSLDRLLEEGDRAVQSVACALVPVVGAAEIKVVCLYIPNRALRLLSELNGRRRLIIECGEDGNREYNCSRDDGNTGPTQA